MTDHHLQLEFPSGPPSSDHFRIAYDLYRCIAFYNAALADTANHDAMVEDAILNAHQALLNVAYLLRAQQQEHFMKRLEEIFSSLQKQKDDAHHVFSALRTLCGRVISMLGISKEELNAELEAYPRLRDEEMKNSLRIIFEFLYTKKVLPTSKFDSSQKARIHRLVDVYGEERMKKRKIYREYVEFRNANKLRISSPTAALGALEELLLLSDAPTRIIEPLTEKVREYKKCIVETISTSSDQNEIDVDSFDVESYLKQRFTKEYEQGHARPDMDPALIKEIDALAFDILHALFPELTTLDADGRQQRILAFLETDGAFPKSSLAVPHIYAED